MSTRGGIRTLFFAFSVFTAGVIIPAESFAETEGPIPSFAVEGFSGSIDSTWLFVGRRVVLAVIGPSCPGVEPFLSFRKRLDLKGLTVKTDRALILCIGGKREEKDTPIWSAPNEAMAALGITGTPMLLGIEDNRVKWRMGGLVPKWQVLAENWLREAMDNE